jgi:6-phosphogluconate dehydrogenase
MQVGKIGLGRMGGNMTRRLLRGGHHVVAYDLSEENRHAATAHGALAVTSLSELTAALDVPRIIWMMVPAGMPVEQTIMALLPDLAPGDILIDGGNSNYKDSMRRAAQLGERGIHFLDIGTSGGIWGLTEGYCLMVGGDAEAFHHIEPILATLAPEDGYAHVGPSGAGHFAKMVHNGIEYGLMQAYGEGFEILHAKREFDFDLHQVSALWNRGSVVRSWLLELVERAFEREPDLQSIKDWVADSGEGRWTVLEAIDLDVPAPVITHALFQRFVSRQEESFSAKVVAALRNEFGGHDVKREEH